MTTLPIPKGGEEFYFWLCMGFVVVGTVVFTVDAVSRWIRK